MDPIKFIAEQIENDTDGVQNDKGSELSNAVALDVVAIVRDELHKIGCRLDDYYVDFNAGGFDISRIKIDTNDPARVIDIVKHADPSVRHEVSKQPNKYAYMAANVAIADRIRDELGLEYKALGSPKDGKDTVLVSVREPEEEKPLPPEQEFSELPPEVIHGVEEPIEPEEGGELDLGGLDLGGGGADLGSRGGGADLGAPGPEAEGEAGEEEISPEEVPELPEAEEGEGEEPSPEAMPGEEIPGEEEIEGRPRKRRPGMEY
jgi:hypothetical protein